MQWHMLEETLETRCAQPKGLVAGHIVEEFAD